MDPRFEKKYEGDDDSRPNNTLPKAKPYPSSLREIRTLQKIPKPPRPGGQMPGRGRVLGTDDDEKQQLLPPPLHNEALYPIPVIHNGQQLRLEQLPDYEPEPLPGRLAVCNILLILLTLSVAITGTTLVALEDRADPDKTTFGVGWGLLGFSYLLAFFVTRYIAMSALKFHDAEDDKDPVQVYYTTRRVREGLPVSVASVLMVITIATVLLIENRPFELVLGSVMLGGTFLVLMWWLISRAQYDYGVTKLAFQTALHKNRSKGRKKRQFDKMTMRVYA